MFTILFCLLLSENPNLYAQIDGVDQFLLEEFLMNLEDFPEPTEAHPIPQNQISARKSLGYYSRMSLEELIKEIDNYVDLFSEADRDKLTTNYIPGSESNLNSMICNFGVMLSKQNGDFRPGWNTGNIYSKKGYSKKELIRHYRKMKGDVLDKLYSEYTIDEFINNIFLKKGYSVKNVINHYRRFKGDVINEKVSFSKLSFRELILVMDKIVFENFSNDPDALPLNRKNGVLYNFYSLWQNYGLKLAIEKGDYKKGWKHSNILVQPGYGFKELKAHYIAHRDKCRHTFDFSGKISPSP